ncbi:hypothetical protein BpHYR1_034020 [Brachionus plicatilis]|uniref:Uncharacterized protein n=1 Tax=Brachionus plicatilis TaxID=10195 RepID=A0A3M7PHM4_BRAPC|nr:hypothetical protein BpHYR1_034020 [Brachionus plicatilis]
MLISSEHPVEISANVALRPAMSDTSLNEIQPKLLKLDTPDQDPALSKKQDSLFIVPSPQSTTSNLTTVTLNDPRKPSPQNKVHVIPYNLTSQKTTPIKLIKDLKPASQSTISSSIGSKKLIQVNAFSSSANTGSNLATSPIRANNLFINSSDKSPKSNTKILTISNGLNSGSSLPNSNKIQYVKIVNTPNVSSNSAPFKITTITSSHNANSNNSQVIK